MMASVRRGAPYLGKGCLRDGVEPRRRHIVQDARRNATAAQTQAAGSSGECHMVAGIVPRRCRKLARKTNCSCCTSSPEQRT